MAKRRVQTTAVPIRTISKAEAEGRRNPPPSPISKVPMREVPKLEEAKPDWWTPARQHALDVVEMQHMGLCAQGHPSCSLHTRIIDPRYKPTWIVRPASEEFSNCKVVTHTRIGPGTDKPGYIPMTVHQEQCVFLQPGIERTRLTRATQGIGSLKAEEMIKTWQEEDRERMGRAVPAVPGRTVGSGSGRTLPTGQGSMFSSRAGAGGRRLDPVGEDEAAQTRPEFTVLARGVDSQFRPIVKVRIEGMPHVGLKPNPRHGPVVVVKPADRPAPRKPGTPGVLTAEATNEIIISVAHAREYWRTLGRGAKRTLQREGLAPKPEDDIIRDTVRAWWKDIGTK